jgi:cell division septum initiation protein DivIVA
MQDILAFLPLPNRRELDDVEQEVYKLRKTVKTLEKELKDIKTMLAGLPVNTTAVKQ